MPISKNHSLNERMIDFALPHLCYLTKGLGHRGSTTDKEAHAAEYLCQQLAEAGIEQLQIQPFQSAVTLWRPYLICLLLALVGVPMHLLGPAGRLMASVLNALACWWIYRELNFETNPIRRLLPKGFSQNVLATIPANGPRRAVAVVVSHLDSGQTPLLFRSQPGLLLFVILSMATVLTLGLNAVLYAVTAFNPGRLLIQIIWAGILVQVVALAFALEAERSPYTQGANDNASAVAVALAVARQAIRSPFRHMDLMVLFSGCEEVGCYGMLHFLSNLDRDHHETYFIVLEGVGLGDLHCSSREGMLKTYPSAPELLAMAETIAQRRPDLGGQPHPLRAGYTETGVIVKHGLKGITLLGLQRGTLFKYLPYWHQPDDRYENLDSNALEKAAQFVWEMLSEIDRQAA